MLTKELLKQLPALGATDAKDPGEVKVIVKFFDPAGSWSWYGWEYDPDERRFFGMVQGFENELGYFSLTELEEIRRPLGLRIERDLHFQQITVKELMDKLNAGVHV